ncbi:hypothetical protein NDU88_004922 [Pleurodeles waltl]|uniref:Uncharacterized protein n=1 Tax=Pleurodeles waltl TaxID=8319 RepID=A0AAV7W841_PLEWA|nr:hypothetical protein NDU88_004922 [Pleurodeles waltl]
MLQEEGRDDLLQEGVLDKEGAGIKRPRRASSDGVAAAVIACSPPVTGKKCQQKSVMGRRYAQAAAVNEEAEVFVNQGLPCLGGVRRGGSRPARRAGASLRQHVASRGRGAAEKGEVAPSSRVGAEARRFAHAPASRKKAGRVPEQAPLSSRNKGKRGEGGLDESTWAGSFKMAARIGDRQEPILILSDSEGYDPVGNGGIKSSVPELNLEKGGESSMFVQWDPRLVSPMLHRVQQWGVENRTLVQTGLMEVSNKGDCMLGEVMFEEVQLGDGYGRGQVSGLFRKISSDYGVPGCGTALALGGQEEHLSKAGQGRPAFISGHTVGVSTPLRHLQEERLRPGAAHLTSGESVMSSQVRKSNMNYDEPSTSQSAGGFTWDVGFEETLDFDDDNEMDMVGADLGDVGGQGNNQSLSFDVLQGQKRAAVRSDRRVVERIASGSAGNLPRGEERGGVSEREGRGSGGMRSNGARERVQDMGVQTGNASMR